MHVLFVCTGNTCRSPMAEALARAGVTALGMDDCRVSSAGLFAMAGQAASPGALQAMAQMGLSLTAHRARPLTREILAQADCVLTMTDAHARAVRDMVPTAPVATLCGFAGEDGDIPDPYGGSDAEYLRCAQRLAVTVGKAMQRLRDQRDEEAT